MSAAEGRCTIFRGQLGVREIIYGMAPNAAATFHEH